MIVFMSYVLLLGVALLLAVIGVIISLLGQKACLSKQCVGQAKFIHRGMDKDLNPCDDFYSFVCSRFPKFGTSIMDEIEMAQLTCLVEYLSVPASWEENDRLEHVAKTLYQSCVNDSRLKEEGLKPLQRTFMRIGSIPFLDPLWDYSWKYEYEILDNDLKHFFTGLNSLFVYNRIIKMQDYPSLNPKNETSNEQRKHFFHAFSIPPHLYTAVPPDPENYLKYCIEINDLYKKGLLTNKTITEKDIREIKAAVNFKLKFLTMIDKTVNCTEQIFKFEDINEYKKRFGKSHPDDEEYVVPKVTTYIQRKAQPGIYNVDYIVVTQQFNHYIDQLQELIQNIPDRVMANYMGVEALIQVTPFLPKEYRDAYDKYLKPEKDKNNKVIEKRDVHCAKLVKDAMSTALTYQFLRDHIWPPKGVGNLKSLTLHLKKHLKDLYKKIKWPSREDRIKMYRLVNKIKIVSPLSPEVFKKLTNKTAFDNFFMIMCSSDSSILETYLNTKLIKYIRNAQLLNIKTDLVKEKTFTYTVFHDDYDIFDVNILFDRDHNYIVVPMAFLKYPSLDNLWPKYLSYGGLGVWIAHQIIKVVGYDNVLHPPQYKDFGGPVKEQWWSKDTISRYESNRECAFKEYNAYLRPFRIQSNDPNCMEETLYYAAALQAAYYAYKEDTKMRFFVEPKIPYMKKYNVDQIFFIKYASSFCQFGTPDKIWYRKSSDSSRVTPNFTVQHSLRNFEPFVKAFGCRSDERMGKANPCSV